MSVLFCNLLDRKERAVCFTLTVFPMSRDSQSSVALPRGDMGWSAYVIVVFSDHTHLLFRRHKKGNSLYHENFCEELYIEYS